MNKLKIIYEDKYYFAINKPACVHSCIIPKSPENTSIAWQILRSNPSASDISKKPEDAGLLNRLDFETSGIMLAAKTREAWQLMHQLYTNRNIQKKYYAVLEGKIKNTVNVQNYIGSAGRGARKVKIFRRKPALKYRARQALSVFKLIKYSSEKKLSFVEVEIETGVRHQIRAHAKEIGHPLAGDKLYGAKTEFSNFLLHAFYCSFIHPYTSKNTELLLAPTAEMKELMLAPHQRLLHRKH